MLARFHAAVLAALSLLVSVPAMAVDDYTIQSGGVQRKIRSRDIGDGRLVPQSIPSDVSGTPILTLNNPGYLGVTNWPSTWAATQSGVWAMRAQDGAGNALTSALVGSARALDVIVRDSAGNQISSFGGGSGGGGGATGSVTAPGTSGTQAQAVQGATNGVPLPVVIPGTLPAFASTPTFNLGTIGGAATAANQTVVTGSATGGTAAGSSTLNGGVYRATAPTLTDGQQAAAQFDAAARLLVNTLTAGGSSSANQALILTALTNLKTSTDAVTSAINAGVVASLPAGTNLIGSIDTVVRATSTDRGGTITAGGTAQQFMAANASRRGFVVQNQSTGDLYVNCVATAAANQTSLKIPAGALYDTPAHHAGTGACSIFGATTAQAFYAREF